MRMLRPARHDFSLDLVRALRVLTLAALVMALALGCGSESEDPVPVGPQGCPTGSVPWTDGSCMPVGIQGCADIFIEEDGLCHPRMAKCPAGTIPKFDEGCVPVGIQGCAEMFMEEDGLCHPSITKCPAGTIPKFDEGCVPVGIQGCAEVFMEDDGLCHPTMEKCPAGTFAVPQEGCVPIDGPEGCGTGTWGNLQEVAGVTTIWVDPSVAASGNGTMASPVKSIAEAMAMVPVGGRVALGAGTYDEPIHITKTVTIEGRCPSMVRVQGTGTTGAVTFIVWVDTADDVALRGLEIGGAGFGVFATDTAGLRIDGVRVRGATSAGLLFEGSTTEVSLERSWIDGTLADTDGYWGDGIDAAFGAQATIIESAITASHSVGVFVSHSGTIVTVEGSLIEGTLPQESDGMFGRGAEVGEGATLTLVDSAIVKNHSAGIVTHNPGSELSLATSLVEGTLPTATDATFGEGLSCAYDAKLTLLATAVIDNHRAGVFVFGTNTEANVVGSLISRTLQQQSDGTQGNGAMSMNGAKLTLHQSAIFDNDEVGLLAMGSGTEAAATYSLIEEQIEMGVFTSLGPTLTLDSSAMISNRMRGISAESLDTKITVTRSLVSETLASELGLDGGVGSGIVILAGAQATLASNAVIDNHNSGLSVQGKDTTVTATGNLIAGTLSTQHASGVQVSAGATLTLDTNALFSNHSTSIATIDSGTTVIALHNTIDSTISQDDDNKFGRGIDIESGSEATLEGNAVVANHDAGIFVHGSASWASATGNLVEGTLPQESDGHYGNGIVSTSGATLLLESSVIYNNHMSAMLVDGSSASVDRCLIGMVRAGSAPHVDMGIVDNIGDGLQATAGSTLDITDTRIQGCVRAGVLFDDSTGTLSDVVSTDNQFGLVLQGERRPTYESGNNQFTGNTGQDILLGGDLPVPDALTPIPDGPTPTPSP